MLWLNKHARLRNQLSPYLDGALSPAGVSALEAHLSACDACRAELDELRSTVSAARDLAQVDTPRSFALTPEMLERRAAAPAPSAPPLALGIRLASAAVAVFLAVVVIGDLSDAGGGNGDDGATSLESAARSRNIMEFDAEADAEQADGGAAAPAPQDTGRVDESDTGAADEDAPSTSAPPAADVSDACPPGAAAGPATGDVSAGAGGPATGDGGAGAGGQGATAAATPSPQPAPTTTPDPEMETQAGAAAGAGTNALCQETPVAGAVVPVTAAADAEAQRDVVEEAAPAPHLEPEDGGGVSSLRVLEMVLAGSLMALLAGIALELAIRRRRAV